MATAGGPDRRRRSPAAHERRRDPERTRARILDAATAEFAAKGFAGARVTAIASRAGVNQQLIAYYFDGKEGLYREIGRRWLAYEAEAFPADLDYAEVIARYVRTSVEPPGGGRLLAWEGLADDGTDGPADADVDAAAERATRLREEVAGIRERQASGELDDRIDPDMLLLIAMSAANGLAVYPQLARALFGADAGSPETVARYAEALATLLVRSTPSS